MSEFPTKIGVEEEISVSEEIRMWEILGGEDLREVKRTKLGLESRIEDWLEKDIAIISDELLVVGRQVQIAFGGIVDLLCLDSQGFLPDHGERRVNRLIWTW